MHLLKQFLIIATLSFSASASDEMTPHELEKWFQSDDPAPIKKTNEGKLVFLDKIPAKATLHSINTFIIDNDSIENGWVKLTQCYKNLDAVPVAEVVYQYRFMRQLKIKFTKNILKAHVSGQSVQLEDIGKNATLCVDAEVRNFYQNEDKSFSLVNGPYHRKFLDSYFPYHLTMNIQYPEGLRFISSKPKTQKGFKIKQGKNTLDLDTWFEGKLNTEFRFILNQ